MSEQGAGGVQVTRGGRVHAEGPGGGGNLLLCGTDNGGSQSWGTKLPVDCKRCVAMLAKKAVMDAAMDEIAAKRWAGLTAEQAVIHWGNCQGACGHCVAPLTDSPADALIADIEAWQDGHRYGDGLFLPDDHSMVTLMELWEAGRVVPGSKTSGPGARLGWYSVRMIDADHAEALIMNAAQAPAEAKVMFGRLLTPSKPGGQWGRDADDPLYIPPTMTVRYTGTELGEWRASCDACDWRSPYAWLAQPDACTEAREHVCEQVQVPDPFLPIPAVVTTMWDLLSDAEKIRFTTQTVYADGRPASCSGCGVRLVTEEDFHKHFVVPDSAHPADGHCPMKSYGMLAKAYLLPDVEIVARVASEDAVAWLHAEAAAIRAAQWRGMPHGKRKHGPVRRVKAARR